MRNMNDFELHQNEKDGVSLREQLLNLRLEMARKRRRQTTSTIVPREGSKSPIPLSYAQERLWFLEQLGVSAAYNMPMVLRLEGVLDVGALARSFTEVIRRHESLRTHFESIDGGPIQVVDPPSDFVLAVTDLVGLSDADKSLRIQELSRDEAQSPFDLRKGPLLRASLLKLTEEEHVLLLTMHHIVSDGWSLQIMNRELSVLYGWCLRKRSSGSSPLQELEVQYADYAVWQRGWLQGDVLDKQLRYWRERLGGAPQHLQLPTDSMRTARQTYRGGEVIFTIRAALCGALEQIARSEGATLFMVMLAAFKVQLSRYSGQSDIVVGSPIAGRTNGQTENLIGVFVNMLILRTDLSGRPTFRRLLERVKEGTLEAYAHQEVPFEKLVMELRPERTLSRQPLFQVTLAMQNFPRDVLRLGGLKWSWLGSRRVTTQFDLGLLLYEDQGGLEGRFEFASDLFNEETIKGMSVHFRALLEAIVADPDCRIDELPMRREKERQALQVRSNQSLRRHVGPQCLHGLISQQVERTPDSIAVISKSSQLTYRKLEERAGELSDYLRSMEIGPEAIVAICLERSLEMMVAMVGILKAGAAYLPLDPGYPEGRLRFMLNDANCSILLTTTPLSRRLPNYSGRTLLLDADWKSSPTGRGPESSVHATAGNLAYVIYTSGSTGTPKAVCIPHEAVCNQMLWMIEEFAFSQLDAVLQKTPLSFDASVWEVFAPLLCGARVVLAVPDGHKDPSYLCRTIRGDAATVLQLVPSMLQFVVAEPSFARCLSLRHVFSGGEALSTDLRDSLYAKGSAALHNLYGPTEACVQAVAYSCQRSDVKAAFGVPIGKAVWNTQLHVLDDRLQPVPIGALGELYIGGLQVGRGYLNRPLLTAERFVANPFGAPGARLYRTGDLVRERSDGNLEFRGRVDSQVKVRGFRLELGEIETELRRHKHVEDAAVLAREDVLGEKRLVAYVVGKGSPYMRAAGGTGSESCFQQQFVRELREDLENRLPEYMVPSAWVVLERLPLAPNGKLDRLALPPPQERCEEDGATPDNDFERKLAVLWAEVLRLSRVGMQDNFFQLGGHSLLALRLLFKINQEFGSTLGAADLYQSPTIRKLSRRIQGRKPVEEFVDLLREATLDQKIVPTGSRADFRERAVMVTGGTGFVGRFLMAQILQDSDVTVYCLVRGRSPQEVLSRVRTTWSKWNLWRPEFEQRLIAVPGDLSLPHLGVDPRTYTELSENVDSIYHCGTSMNHLETYAMAKQANVEGAKELVKLSACGRVKVINYISTLGVFSSDHAAQPRVVNERTPIDHERHRLSSGYLASKWVSEKVFMTASERGIPCNTFRLGLVWGDTQQGRYDELQREYRLLVSSLLLGCGIQNCRYEMIPTPVDYVARAVVFLSRKYSNGGGLFHISSSKQEVEEGVFERCNAIAGTSLELLPLREWVDRARSLLREGVSLPITPLLESFEQTCGSQANPTQFDSYQTDRELDQAGIVAPPFGDPLIKVCVESMLSRDPTLSSIAVRRR